MKFCHNCGTLNQVTTSKTVSDGVRGLKEIRGWVYIISNKSMPGLLKIGYSTKDPELRAKEFNNAGIPHSYIVEYDVLLENPYYVEQETHKKLMQKNKNKEWFCCTVEEAIIAIKSVVGSTYIKENFKCTNNLKLEDATKAKEILQEEKIDYTVDELIKWVALEGIREVGLLIAAGVNVNGYGSEYGETALMAACRCSEFKIAQYLLDNGADINAMGKGWAKDNNPLIEASRSGEIETVKFLVNHGADIEAKDTEGETSLMKASRFGETEIVQFLLHQGANIHAEDSDGNTALVYAEYAGKMEMVQFLQNHGA